MDSIKENTSAFTKVLSDCIKLILPYEDENTLEENNEFDDNFDDNFDEYFDTTTIENFTNEENSNRILKEHKYSSIIKAYFSSPTHVIDNIFLGSTHNAANRDTLKKYNIKYIFNITKEFRNYYDDTNEFIYMKCCVCDDNNDNISRYFKDVYEKIIECKKNNDGNILVHCMFGRSRSASIILYYLIRNSYENGESCNLNEALDYLLEKRPVINPTHRFIKDIVEAIKEFETTDKIRYDTVNL